MPTKKIDSKVTDTKLDDAKALVAADAQAKADAAADTKAKADAELKKAERAARTPEQNLQHDWPKKHEELAPFITQLGKVRGGLLIPDQNKAKKILKGYGFKKFKLSGTNRSI